MLPVLLYCVLENDYETMYNYYHSLKNKNEILFNDDYGNNLLHYMCTNTEFKLEIIKFLIDSNVDINQQNVVKKTPLHLLVEFNNELCLKNVEKFLKYKCDLSIKDDNNNTAFHLACMNKNVTINILELLKTKEIYDLNKDNMNPLHLACIMGNHQIIEYLINLGFSKFSVDKYNETPLHKISIYKYNKSLNLLVDKEIILMKNLNKYTPLSIACSYYNHDIATFFYDICKIPIVKLSKTLTPSSQSLIWINTIHKLEYILSILKKKKPILIKYLMLNETILENNPIIYNALDRYFGDTLIPYNYKLTNKYEHVFLKYFIHTNFL